MSQPIGVTGMGILSSIGDKVPAFSDALRRGACGVRRMSGEREAGSPRLAAEIRDFAFPEMLAGCAGVPEGFARSAKRLGQRAPFPVQVAILSALEAWQMAGLFDACPAPERVGLVVAGQNSAHNHQYRLQGGFRQDPEYLSPRCGLEFLETNNVGILSELFHIRGEGFVAGGASATGNVGIIKAYQLLLAGIVDVCVVAGIVADPSPMDIQGFFNMGAMGGKAFADRPDQACRPFDVRHEGFIFGQAGACLILETAGSAANRRASPLAAIKGGAINLDGNCSSDPNADGEIRAMRSALAQSGLSLTDIDYVNTHGSSSPLGDRTEAEAIHRMFEGRASEVWLNSTKGLTGHCLYSAGVVELIATVVQMRDGFLHPNRNLEEPVRKGLRFCGPEAIESPIRTAMSNSFGFGGINTSLVITGGTQ